MWFGCEGQVFVTKVTDSMAGQNNIPDWKINKRKICQIKDV